MSEHTSLLFPHWGQIAVEGLQEANLKICDLRAENERLRSVLKNARNILFEEGYGYAEEIDKALAEQPESKPK